MLVNQDIVNLALDEDIGTGDITAALIPKTKMAQAHIITQEKAVICGVDWVNAIYQTLDSEVVIDWQVSDGDEVGAWKDLCWIKGKARSLLTGERTALNFLQTLSGTATLTKKFVTALAETKVQLLDTRKTLPGLRLAQKYAVRCGGGKNHRLGLYDAFLIKENHINACGSITQAVLAAKSFKKPIEVEVTNLIELEEAIAAKVDIALLDNFSLDDVKKAVALNQGRIKLEVSGGITLDNIATIAQTGVDYISVGVLTKNVTAINLSMLFL